MYIHLNLFHSHPLIYVYIESEDGIDDDGNMIAEDGSDQNGKRKRFKKEVVKKVRKLQ